MRAALAALAAMLLLASCGGSLGPAAFEGGTPLFEPDVFFAGHVRSWGVIEDRAGQPTSRFTTESTGHREGDMLVIDQRLAFEDGRRVTRLWRLRKLDAHRYAATATDIQGEATGEAHGNAFLWTYTLALRPGNPLANVRMTQWMYGQEDGNVMMNRVRVSKLGLTVAGVTEFFRRDP